MPEHTTSGDNTTWRSMSDRLVATLRPFAAPIAISFRTGDQPVTETRRDTSYPEPNEHGRTGQVPAGCVFWVHGSEDTFATIAADAAADQNARRQPLWVQISSESWPPP